MIYDVLLKLEVNTKYFQKKNIKIWFQKMGQKIECRNITITNSLVQSINEISLEYAFDDPKFGITQCNSSRMPIFVATCKIKKESETYMSIGGKSKTKKESKHSSARKLLKFLYKDYLFSVKNEPKMNLRNF